MRLGAKVIAVACLALALAWGRTSAEDDDDDESLMPYYSPTPRMPPLPPAPVSEAVSTGLPPAVCKGRDFADLVADECRPPEGSVAKKPIGKPEAPALPPVSEPRPPSFNITVTPLPAKNDSDFDFDACEEAVTIRELQRNIIQEKDVQCVAQILIQTGSVSGIEGGFRIDPDFNFLPNCGLRQFDPDVVALKGIALGILAGSKGDKGLITKIADGVVPSFFPPGQEVSKDMLDPDEFFKVLSDLKTLQVAFNEDANTVPPCKIHPPKAKKTGPHRPYYPSPPHIYPSPSYNEGRRLLATFPRPSRQLQCADCDNADSFPCAYCWQQDVCGDLYWCQDR